MNQNINRSIFHLTVNVGLMVENLILIKRRVMMNVNGSVEKPIKCYLCKEDYVQNARTWYL